MLLATGRCPAAAAAANRALPATQASPRRPKTSIQNRFGGPPADAAYGAFQRGLYMTALNLALPRAEAGDPAAQTLAAEILSRGLGVARDEAEAAKWYQLAAEQGVPEAQFQYALLLLDGRFVKKDPQGAYALMQAAAEAGNRLAQFNFAQLLVDREPGDVGMAKAVSYYRARRRGRPCRCAICDGADLSPTAPAARSATMSRRGAGCSLAARQNFDTAQLDLGTWLVEGRGGKRDLKAGFGWMKRAADGGNVAAQNRLAKLYMGGIGTEPDSIDAAAWYFLARRAGLTDPEMDDFLRRPDRGRAEAGAGAGQPAALSRKTTSAGRISCLSWRFVVMEAPNPPPWRHKPLPEQSKMAKINGNEIRPGNVIEHDGGLWVAVRTNHVKPGKGGAYNQVELKNLINGTKLNERFRSAETVEKIRLEQKDFSFLYEQGDALVFMDTESYEQLELQKDFVGDRAAFLQDGMMVTVELYDERPIGISLPDQVTLTITEADPVVKGQTAASSYKPAMLENGIRVLVPPFIGSGERIVVDTNEITYVRRAD